MMPLVDKKIEKPDKTYFIIKSYGRTATQWIAAALNLHPIIHCSHGPDSEAARYSHSDSIEQKKLNNIRIRKEMAEFYQSLDIDAYFDKMEEIQPNCSSYGNIHGLSLGMVIDSAKKLKREYNLAHIIRHPVKRVESMKNRWLHVINYNPYTKADLSAKFAQNHQSPLLQKISQDFNVDFAVPSNWLFFMANLYLHRDRRELSVPVSHIPMERVTADIDYFLWFLRCITQGSVEINVDYIKSLKSLNKVDSRSRPSTAFEVFSSWDTWKQWLFIETMNNLDLFEAYENCGYDLSSYLLTGSARNIDNSFIVKDSVKDLGFPKHSIWFVHKSGFFSHLKSFVKKFLPVSIRQVIRSLIRRV